MADAIVPSAHPNLKNLEGRSFGRLTVLRRAGSTERGRATWWCRCSCGNPEEIEAQGTLLLNGHKESCGCLYKETRATGGTKNRTHGHAVGGKISPEYQTWVNMNRRCYDPKDKGYEWYGALGITVCKGWRDSFEAFLRAVGPRPGPGYSIERRKNDRGYELGNCYWATPEEQANNRRSNRLVTYEDETMTAARLARKYGVPPKVFVSRLQKGWAVEEALSRPVVARRQTAP